MELIREKWCGLVLMYTLALISRSACQEDICGYRSPGSVSNISFAYLSTSSLSAEGACRCSLRASDAQRVTVHYAQSLWLRDDDMASDCLPFVFVRISRGSGQHPKAVDFHMCPSQRDGQHSSYITLYPGQELVVHLDNPGDAGVSMLTNIHQEMSEMTGGRLDVECSGADLAISEYGCPCTDAVWDASAGAATPEDFNLNTRLAIGLSAACGILLIVGIILAVLFVKRRRERQEKKQPTDSSVENKAYQGSKQSVAEPKSKPSPQSRVNYAPDPNLNLSLQSGGKPGHHGSRDSGLSSNNEPHDKNRLPFMQPQGGASLSFDNLMALPENYPPLAGRGGSQSSLDGPRGETPPVEPIYTTRGGGGGGGGLAGQPDLAGRGSQNSLDHDPPQRQPRPGDGDVYAQIQRPPGRSASVDRLAPRAQDEKYQSYESLNASRVTIETDV